jgi:hypothetical protein
LFTRAGSASAVIACLAVLALAGCGGGGGSSSNTHTYVIAPDATNALAKNIYVTIVSPVPIPTKLLTSGGSKIVGQAQGPEKCSVTKTVQGSHGPGAFLSGKSITIKVNGTNPFTVLACNGLKKTPFKASNLGK